MPRLMSLFRRFSFDPTLALFSLCHRPSLSELSGNIANNHCDGPSSTSCGPDVINETCVLCAVKPRSASVSEQ